jgi:hypothetical protein
MFKVHVKFISCIEVHHNQIIGYIAQPTSWWNVMEYNQFIKSLSSYSLHYKIIVAMTRFLVQKWTKLVVLTTTTLERREYV